MSRPPLCRLFAVIDGELISSANFRQGGTTFTGRRGSVERLVDALREGCLSFHATFQLWQSALFRCRCSVQHNDLWDVLSRSSRTGTGREYVESFLENQH